MKKQIAIIMICSLLPACAVMSKKQCEVASWEGVGQGDALDGRSIDHISQYNKACTKHGIVPNARAYAKGYDQGATMYCDPRVAIQRGRTGASYNLTVCNDEQIDKAGHLYYREQVDNMNNRMSKLENQIQRIKQRHHRVRKAFMAYDQEHHKRQKNKEADTSKNKQYQTLKDTILSD